MANVVFHAMSSAKKHGGKWEEYIHIHNWFDETKAWIPDSRHRAMRHHAEGIFECEKVFGPTVKVTLTSGHIKEVPTRLIGEQHVIEDCGFIPKAWDYVQGMKKDLWMRKVGVKLDVNLDGKLTEEKDVEL
jgi:hypothetical protein